MMNIEPIAYFKSPFKTKFGIPRQSGVVETLRGEIRFSEKYRRAEAVKGLEGFDYLWLIWGFSANARSKGDWQPVVRPPRLGGNATMGVFATRSPFRPNPLGLSSVRIEKICMEGSDAPLIQVCGADLMDGTPIYDIKPYIPYTDAHPEASGGFTDSSEWTEKELYIEAGVMEELQQSLNAEDIETLKKILAQDPRPHYQKVGDRVYGMEFKEYDVHFRAEGEGIRLLDITESNK